MIIANYKKIVRRKDKHYLSPKTVVFVKYKRVGRAPSGANTQPLGVMLYASIFFLKTTKKRMSASIIHAGLPITHENYLLILQW